MMIWSRIARRAILELYHRTSAAELCFYLVWEQSSGTCRRSVDIRSYNWSYWYYILHWSISLNIDSMREHRALEKQSSTSNQDELEASSLEYRMKTMKRTTRDHIHSARSERSLMRRRANEMRYALLYNDEHLLDSLSIYDEIRCRSYINIFSFFCARPSHSNWISRDQYDMQRSFSRVLLLLLVLIISLRTSSIGSYCLLVSNDTQSVSRLPLFTDDKGNFSWGMWQKRLDWLRVVFPVVLIESIVRDADIEQNRSPMSQRTVYWAQWWIRRRQVEHLQRVV